MTKILHPLLIETLSKLENKGNYLKGGIYIFKKKKTYDDFIITVEKKKTMISHSFSIGSERR